MYYTTVLAIILGIVAAALIAGATLIALRTESGATYWSTLKVGAFWTCLGLALICIIVTIAAPITSMQEARKTERGLGDGPRFTTELIDGRPVDGITEMADNFPNVATKCVWDGWRAFVTSNGDHLFVVRDESCTYEETGPS